MAENISRQLRAWADALQNSDIKGHRYLTDKVRRDERAVREREEFREELRRAQAANIKRINQRNRNEGAG